MRHVWLSVIWMVGIVVLEILLVFALFVFSTHFQVLFVILSSLIFFGLLFFLLYRRIREQSNLKPQKEVINSYLRVFRNVGLFLLGATFLIAFIKAGLLLLG